jgi:hypothetical protein
MISHKIQGTSLLAPRLLAPQEKLRSLGTFNERAIKEHLEFCLVFHAI